MYPDRIGSCKPWSCHFNSFYCVTHKLAVPKEEFYKHCEQWQQPHKGSVGIREWTILKWVNTKVNVLFWFICQNVPQ